jgi:ferritin
MNPKIVTAINHQINAEFESGYAYLAMSSYFSEANLDGFAHWTSLQAQEEIQHGMKLFHFLHERDARADLEAVAKPQQNWGSPLEVFELVYKLEKEQSGRIGKLLDLAIAENEHSAKPILHWFLEEQVEEEAAAKKILEKLEMVKGNPAGLLFLDKEFGSRIHAAGHE